MKTYIGEVEALEVALERGCELPKKGHQNLTVHAVATGLPVEVLGRDSKGFYLSELSNSVPTKEVDLELLKECDGKHETVAKAVTCKSCEQLFKS